MDSMSESRYSQCWLRGGIKRTGKKVKAFTRARYAQEGKPPKGGVNAKAKKLKPKRMTKVPGQWKLGHRLEDRAEISSAGWYRNYCCLWKLSWPFIRGCRTAPASGTNVGGLTPG